MKKDDATLTASMEDYLEMIYRLSAGNGFTRVNELSQSLNVQPPSATKMVQRLAEMGYVKYEKYGFIMMNEKGKQTGTWLLKRHLVIENLIRLIGVNEIKILQETEKIEHTLSKETVACFETFVTFMLNNPDIAVRYAEFKTGRA
jgi:Mn-dependent DtxR family transcriptional regulator